MRRIIVDGSRIDDLDGFFDEIARRLCPGFDGFGRNLDALNDVLRGGFGVFAEDEPIMLEWRDADHGRKRLGYPALISYLDGLQARAHPSNRPALDHRVAAARHEVGPTLFDLIVATIRARPNVTLELG